LAALRKTDLQSIWVDLNSLKAPNCWVIGNANCPYGNSVLAPSQLKLMIEFFERTKSNCTDCCEYFGYNGVPFNVFG